MATVKKAKKAVTKTKKTKPASKAMKKSAPAAAACTCMKFGKFYYCMEQRPDGSFERCPTLPRFRTLEECQQHSC